MGEDREDKSRLSDADTGGQKADQQVNVDTGGGDANVAAPSTAEPDTGGGEGGGESSGGDGESGGGSE